MELRQNEGSYSRATKQGHEGRKDHRIRHTAVVHRTASAPKIRDAVGITVRQRTVRNRLLQEQLRARCHVVCIPPTPSHCRLQRQWCQVRAHWRMEWISLTFSDESRFCLGDSDGRVLVRRTLATKLSAAYTWSHGLGRNFL
ncbi:transposable element Tc1 transposase [Trichonephila clavipes]|nr:transposable element Tc1 transposase [Trichonephila clavipes]